MLMPGDSISITAPEPLFVTDLDFGRTIVEKVGVKESGGQVRVLPFQNFPVPVVGIGVRPVFECMITSINVSLDEHKKEYSWSLGAEER